MTKICVKNANTMVDAALNASRNLGWKVVLKEKNADVLVHSQATANALVEDITSIKPSQKVSKIPGSSHVAKKHVLADVLKRASKIIKDSEAGERDEDEEDCSGTEPLSDRLVAGLYFVCV